MIVRLFLALPLDEATRQRLAGVSGELRRRWPSRATWVKPEHLHLTLRFLGELDRPRAEALAEALSPALRGHAPFSFALHGLGAFPSPARATVLWAGITPCLELLQIHATIKKTLSDCGFPPEDKPFSPHLTLARVRERGKVSEAPAVLEALSSDVSGKVDAREVILYESRLSPAGPSYSEYGKFPLSG